MDLSLYKARINATSSTESVMNHTALLINEEFEQASTYRKIKINQLNGECIFKRTEDSKVLKIILRPNELMNIGDYVEMNDEVYLATEFIPNEISPNAEIQICNATLKWKNDNGDLHNYKCIVTGNSYEFGEQTGNERMVYISNAELNALVQYNDKTKTIKPEQRFVFGEYAYKVTSIDCMSFVHNQTGYIQLGLESTGVSNNDDIITGVADENNDSGWGEW